MKSKSQIAGYSILPITVPPLPSFPQATIHTLYIRSHAPKISTENDSRSLFVVNIPIDTTEDHLKSVFKQLVGPGRFESVSFDGEGRREHKSVQVEVKAGKKRKRGAITHSQDGKEEEPESDSELPETWDRALHRSGSSAVVVFVDGKSAEMVLKAVRRLHKTELKVESKRAGREGESGEGGKGVWPVWGGEGMEKKSIPPLGSARYRTHHTLLYPSPQLLQHSIDTFMTSFNKREADAILSNKRQRNEPDADGFITVTKGGRSGVLRREAAETKAKELKEREELRRKEKENGGFYRFQGREQRKREMEELVRDFEGDRKRVEQLKGERRGRFRPES